MFNSDTNCETDSKIQYSLSFWYRLTQVVLEKAFREDAVIAWLLLILLQSNCGRQAEMVQSLLNTPSVVSIGVIWHSETPAVQLLRKFIQRIGTRLHLYDVSVSLFCKVLSHLCLGSYKNRACCIPGWCCQHSTKSSSVFYVYFVL